MRDLRAAPRKILITSPDYSVAMIIALACCAGCVKYRIHWPFMLLSGALCLTGCTFEAQSPADSNAQAAHRHNLISCAADRNEGALCGVLSQFDGRICTLDRELSATVAHDASMQISGPIAVGWAVANASPDTLRAMVGAVVTGIGNIGAIFSVLVHERYALISPP